MSSSHKNITGAPLSLGEIVTVGEGCDFSTIKQALDNIATKTMMDEVDIGSVTVDIPDNSHVATFSDDVLNIIQSGDLLYLDNDASPVYGGAGSHADHYYPILKVGSQSATDYDVILACGIVGGAKSTYTPKVYRPRHYTLFLSSGKHIIDSSDRPTIPNGCNITITSFGASTIYSTDLTNSAGQENGLNVQRYGYTTIRNITTDANELLSAGATNVFPNFEEGLCFLTLSNVQLSGAPDFGNGLSLAGLVANDIVIHHAMDHTKIPAADYTVVDGWSVTAWEETDIMTIETLGSRPTTHRRKFRNINCERHDMARNGTDYVVKISGVTNANGGDTGGDTFIDIQNLNIVDNMNKVTAYNLYATGNTASSGTNYIYINGGSLISTGASHLAHITVGADAEISFRDVKDENGNQPTVDSNSGVINWLDDDGQQDISYAASITPNFNHGCKVVVGTLTGAVTVNNPAGEFVKGKKLTLYFEQDTTAGRAITFGANYKVHTNGSGSATNGQKAVYVFEYDGTHWIQVNQATWV